MFKILRPGGRPDERKKGETGAGAPEGRVGAPPARVDPPRIELPRRRAALVSPDQALPFKPSHLKSVDPARGPSRTPAAPPVLPHTRPPSQGRRPSSGANALVLPDHLQRREDRLRRLRERVRIDRVVDARIESRQ